MKNPTYKFDVIFFNGPPSVGKDTLANYAQSFDSRSRHIKFITPLKVAVAGMFNYPIELMETGKDDEKYTKFGKRIREHQIAIGSAMRDIYGQEIFGRMLADRILGMPMQTPYVVVSDLGVTGELKAVAEAIDPERIALFRIRQEGKTFDGDCREYVKGEDYGIKRVYDINNPYGFPGEAKFMIKAFMDALIEKRNAIV